MLIHFSKSGGALVLSIRYAEFHDHSQSVWPRIVQFWKTTKENKAQRALNRVILESAADRCHSTAAQNEFAMYTNRFIR